MSPQEETLSTPAPASSPAPAPIDCPACGTGNTPDSKFCRHCGQLLRPPVPGAKVAAEPTDEEGNDERTSPQEIDARRARQLLDRALQLSERGDLGAAVLACRQAATLDADNSAPFAMLGTLLERSGDVRGAITAYERVVSLSPDNALERESLARLRARLERAPAFHFNPSELFGDDEMLPSIAPPDGEAAPDAVAAIEAVAAPDAVAAPGAAESLATESLAGQSAPAIEARLPPTSASFSAHEPMVADEDPAGLQNDLLPEEPLPLVSAYAPTFTQSPPVHVQPLESETDPFWQTLAGNGRAEASGSGKPAASSLAQALHPETLAIVEQQGLETGALTPAIERRQSQRRQVSLPVATDRRARDRRAPVATPDFLFTPVPRAAAVVPHVAPTPGVRPLDFQFPASPAPRLPMWVHMLRGQSFFGRTLPLVAVGVLSLGFLSWARSQAVSREVARAASDPVVVTTPAPVLEATPAPLQPVQAPIVTPTPVGAALNPVTGSSGGFVISNAPTPPVVAPAPTVPVTSSAPASATNRLAPRVLPRAAAPRTVAASTPRLRPAPVFPRVVPIPPAPVPPPPSSEGNIILPPPRVDIPAPAAPPIQVGSALRPGGGPRQNTIRITQGTIIRSTAPPRTGSTARSEERDAAAAARTGQGDRAINSLTNAIGATGSDSAYLYQQRATAFLQRGDSARAIGDFQSAITAYQDQIDRGENVAAAQAGLRAARAGLAVAQASQ